MHAFRDRNGKDWPVVIDVAAVKRVRRLVGVDLYGLIDDGLKPLGRLLADPVQLVDVLYVLCKDSADHASVSDEDFGRLFSGDTLGAASDAFVEEFTDFFPDAARRAAIGKVIGKARAVERLTTERLTTQVDAIDPASLADRLTGSSSASPASSESTPAPSPSANSI